MENNKVSTPVNSHNVIIELNNSMISRTADSDNSEIVIKSLVIGLYRDGDGDDMPPKAWGSFTLDESKETTISLQLTDSESKALFNNTDGTKCRFFVVANLPDPDKIDSSSTINDLKSIKITSDFDSNDLQESFIMTSDGNDKLTYNKEADRAFGKAILYRSAAKINLKVTVPQSITIESGNLEGTWSVVENGITALLNNGVKKAVSDPENIGNTPWKPADEDQKDAYYTITFSNGDQKQRILKLNENNGDENIFITEIPYYTYPNSWTESLEENHKTTLTLVVPWSNDNGSSYKYFYYQVPVTPTDVTFIERNKSYNIDLTLGILGELVPDVPLEIDNASYNIVSWMEQPLNLTIQDFRYLVVSPNIYTFNNENDLSVPFYTSHPVEIVDVKIQYERFAFVSDPTNNEVGTVVTFDIDEDQIKATNDLPENESTPICTISQTELSGQKYVNIYHPLNLWTPYDKDDEPISLSGYSSVSEVPKVAQEIKYYRPTTEDAFSKYIITYTIQHIDEPSFKEEVTIYQYPAIYIEAERNPASKTEGNVFVNSYTWRYSSSSDGIYGSIFGIIDKEAEGSHSEQKANNKNPNMYIITITSLSEGNSFTVKDEATSVVTTYDYVIGDPRAQNPINGLSGVAGSNTNYTALNTQATAANSNYVEAPALYPNNNKRKLQYYYPTLEDGTVLSMIGPKLRVASSWGATTSINRMYARRRAATYQENAYPAGRWRVPTLAEFSYINKLSNEGKIPILFTPGVIYWTSEGLYKGSAEGEIIRVTNQQEQHAIRAVYDEWYWKEYPNLIPDGSGYYTYTLGDIPRGVQL